MLFRLSLLGTVLLALTLGVAHPGAAQEAKAPAADAPGKGKGEEPQEPQVKIHVSPPCVQPGGLVHVTIEPGSPAMMISSFFDIFFETASRPAFFDVFTEEYFRVHSFFDVFLEASPQPAINTEMVSLSLVSGSLRPMSIELLMRVPPTYGGGSGGGVIMLQDKSGVLATLPVMISVPRSSINHTLGSGQAISSFFDIFTEFDFAGSGPGMAQRRRVLLQQGRAILQKAGDAEQDSLHTLYGNDPRLSLAGQLLQCLLDALERQLTMALMPGH